MEAGCCSSISRADKGDDKVQLAQKISKDDDDNSDNDDGGDGAELLSEALSYRGGNVIPSILGKNPWLIRVADPLGDTPFHVAARAGNEWVVRKLISFMEERPYLNKLEFKKVFTDVNVNGDTALHLALRNDHLRVAYYLVQEEEEALNIVNNDGVTPSQLAKKGWYNRMCAVMAYGSPNYSFEPDIFNENYARHERHAGLTDVEMRALRADLEGGSSGVGVLWAELYDAMNKGQDDLVGMMLMRNRYNYQLMLHKDEMGENLLHAAVRAVGQTELGTVEHLVQYLIGLKQIDNARFGNVNGDTALHLALQKENLTVVHRLIKASPETVLQGNHKGDSPLYLAVMAGHQDLVKYMCQMLAESNFTAYLTNHYLNCHNHSTLLHLAIKDRALGTLETLMEYLPRVIKGTDEKGWRPLSYAAYKGYLDEVTYLLTHFPKSATKYDKDGSLSIHKAVGGGHVSILQSFLTHCPQSLNHVDRKGRSVLHIAVRYARADILSYITKNFKMDHSFLNLKDNDGQTFMDYTKKLKRYGFF